MFKQSPYILTLIEEFVEGRTNYIVTKYVPGVPPGVNLLTYIQNKAKRSRQSEENARNIFTQMALGVQDMHRRGIVHGDLNNMNVLITDYNKDSDQTPDQQEVKIKIADFALAHPLQKSKTIITKNPGVIAKMSSSVIYDTAWNFQDDIRNLGVMLYQILSCRIPKRRETVEMAVDATIKYEEKFAQPVWKHISKNCKNLISRMLDENAAKRLTIE